MFQKIKHVLLTGVFMMASTAELYSADPAHNKNLSHEKRDASLAAAIGRIVEKVKSHNDLPYITVQRQLELVDQLAEFAVGRFFLERGGLNGYWTDYAIKHPTRGRLTGLNSENRPFTELEDFLLNRAPWALATQQRFEIFKAETQKRLYEGAALASIPCGLMSDLLDLDFSSAPNTSLTGIDLDPESIAYAKHYAASLHLDTLCTFIENDAWALSIESAFDLITSNGLAIYEPDDQKVIDLYRGFWVALKPGGCLITSFLTPPPAPGFKTEWKLDAVNMQDVLLQKIVLVDILDSKWQSYRSEEEVKSQLEKAGFIEIEVIYDTAYIFPTVIAKKPADPNQL